MSSSKIALIEGTLFKKGQVNKAWKERYMVLYDNGIIEYFENYWFYKEAIKNGKSNNSKKEHEINLKQVKSFKIITTNETNKKSDREYTFQLITNHRTYTLSCQHKQQFDKWSKLIETLVYGQIIIKGFMFRQGDVRKSHWKKSYFILYSSQKLMHYENDKKLQIAKGVIDLQQIQGLGYGQEQVYSSKTVIEMKTNSKIYALKCMNEKDLKKWFDAILNTMKTTKETKASQSENSEVIKTDESIPKSPDFLAANSLFNPINIDFTLSDGDNEENMLPESGKFFEDQPFKFSSDMPKKDTPKNTKSEPSKSANAANMNGSEVITPDDNEWMHNDENMNSEYRKMQIELNKEWQAAMSDIVIDKKHTLAMDASSDFCIAYSKKIEADKRRLGAQTPLSPKSADSQLLASIPKMKSTRSVTRSRDSPSVSLVPSFESDGILEPFEFESAAPDLEKFASMSLIPKKLKLQNSNTAESKLESDDEDMNVPLPIMPEDVFSAKSEMFIDVANDEECDENTVKNKKKIQKKEKMKLFSNCSCISRLVIIMKAYEKWMHYKIENKDAMNVDEGFRGLISVLTDYNLSDLLNDYYHVKRFHVESTKQSKNSNSDDIKTGVLDPQICAFFKTNVSKCNVLKCLCFERNIIQKMNDEQLRKEKYLFTTQSGLASSRETVEIVTQQIMDTIHCYLFHLSYCIRNIVGAQSENKFVTMTNTKEPSEENKENVPSMPRVYSRYDSHFGTNDDDKKEDAKYESMKNEVLECEHALSNKEWIEIYYKSELFLQSFEANKVRCKKDFELSQKAKFKKNSFMNTEFVLCILLYCNYDNLRKEYRQSHKSNFSKFYHFDRALSALINGFGVNMYDDNISSMQSTHFYHCFSSPVLFKKLRCEFNGGPVSLTIIKSIVFTNMYSDKYKDGIIVQMDLNGSSGGLMHYFDVSIFSNFAYESERLFYGKMSLSITNIIESDISSSSGTGTKFNYHSNYLNAITLLRMIIGDCVMHKSHYANNVICERLTLLISLEMNYRRNKNNKNMQKTNKKIANKQLVPEYIGKLFNNWCMNTTGVIVLKLSDILKLSQTRLQSYFLSKPRVRRMNKQKKNETKTTKDEGGEIALSWKILFEIFPFVTKILCYGIGFNEYLCKTFCDFLSSGHYKNNLQNKSKVNECILQFEDDKQPFDEWTTLIEKYQQILKENECEWSINARIPDQNSLDVPKVSFVKTNVSDDDK